MTRPSRWAGPLLVKGIEPADLLTAVRVVHGGEALLSPTVTRRLIEEFAARAKPPHPDCGAPGLAGALTERSRQLQAMLVRARARGEAPPALDDLIEIVLAPLYFDALFGRPGGAARAPRLVERLLAVSAGAGDAGTVAQSLPNTRRSS